MQTFLSDVDRELVNSAFKICVLAKTVLELFPESRSVWEGYLYDYDPSKPDEDYPITPELTPVFMLIERTADRVGSVVVSAHPLFVADSSDTDDVSNLFGNILWLYLSHFWRVFDNSSTVNVLLDTQHLKGLSL